MQGGVGECSCVNCSSRTMRAATHPSIADPPSFSLSSIWDYARMQLKDFLRAAKETPGSEIQRGWEEIISTGYVQLDETLNPRAFDETASKYRTLPTFLPRQGELVLFHIDDHTNCCFEGSTQHLKLFDESSNQFLGFPAWRAGVVTQLPEDEPGLEDLSTLSIKQVESGKEYQIDLYPDPDSDDKALSSQTYIVELNHIRPLNMFHEVLSGLPQNEWHSTIYNALKVMSTTCFVRPICIRGQWPSATITCGGIWIGPELFVTGDAIRLMPTKKDADQVDSAVIIDYVEWNFHNDNLSEEHATVNIRGKSFTTNKVTAFRPTPLSVSEFQQKQFPTSFSGYSWYPMNKADEMDPTDPEAMLYHCTVVPISRTIGRLYESDAMKYLLDIPDFNVSMAGVKQARRWAKRVRKDIFSSTICDWVHTTHRIRALAIDTLNGLDVRSHPEEKHIRSIRAEAHNQEHLKQTMASGPWTSSSDPSKNCVSRGTSEDGSQDGVLEEAVEGRKSGGSDYNVLTDINESKLQSFQSIVSDSTPGGSENEDEDHNNFILDILSGKVLPNIGDEMNEDLANGGNSDNHRASKRPRL